jgi:hypothetical protein
VRGTKKFKRKIWDKGAEKGEGFRKTEDIGKGKY